MNIISLNNINKYYYSLNNKIKVIDNLSLNLKKGEFLTLVGPSGCGKSTILNILANNDNEYTGEYKKYDNLKIGYMLQEDCLFDWLTVYENAILGLKINKNLNVENSNYVNSLLKKYDLYEFSNKYPSQLSGGMRQRVALIRTLALNPDLLILDEPFSALDYQTRLKICDDVYNIVKQEQKTVLLVTHDISEAVSMSDRIIVLTKRPTHEKKIYNIEYKQKGTPLENRNKMEYNNYCSLIWSDLNE